MGHLHLIVRVPGSHSLQRHSCGRELWQEVDHGRPDEARQGVPLHQEPELGVHPERRAPIVGNTWRTGPEQTGDTRPVRRRRSRSTSWDIFYCQLDYWLFHKEGFELYLTPNGVVLSYVDVSERFLYFGRRPPHEEDVGAKRWNKRQQQSREERGSVDPESSSDAAAGRGSVDPAPGAGSSSEPDADLWIRHLARRERVLRPKVDAKVCLNTAELRKSIDEAEKTQSRRRVEANETMEVDLRLNTAKVHVEQQEALLRQTSSNPWFLFNQDVLALKDAKGNKIYSDSGRQSTRGRLEGHASPSASSSWRCWSREMVAAPLQRLQCTFLFASV